MKKGLPALHFGQRQKSPHLVHQQCPLNHHKSKQELPSTGVCSWKSASTTPPSRRTKAAQSCQALSARLLLVLLSPADLLQKSPWASLHPNWAFRYTQVGTDRCHGPVSVSSPAEESWSLSRSTVPPGGSIQQLPCCTARLGVEPAEFLTV